jgi:hypothetical protein
MTLQELENRLQQHKNFDEAVHSVAQYVADVVISKQRDYGPQNIINSPFGAERGILVRMWDKFARLRNLMQIGRTPKNESIFDTWTDIIGYSLIAIMVKYNVFELPLKEE